MEREERAKEIHDLYEEKSTEHGWETQDKCKVEFKDLPEKNRIVMLVIADYIEEAIKKALTEKEIEEEHLWNTLLKKEGLEKRIDQAKEELDELDEQLDLVKYKPSQKLSPKEKVNLRDEIVDVGMMLESLMIIFKVTASSVAMRKLAKMDKLKTYAYGTNRSVGNVENKGKTTYGY